MLSRTLLALLAVALLAGCGKNNSATPSAAAPSSGPATSHANVLRVGNNAEPEDLDPQAITGVPESKIAMALFEGLLAPDPRDLHPVPGVAESWDISADGLTYTFRLRANAKWSDGTPLTSRDFIESYRRMLSPKFASEYAYLIYNFVVGAKDYYEGRLTDFSQVGFAAPDAHTLVVRLANPTPYLLDIIACHQSWSVVPLHVIAAAGPTDAKKTGWTQPGKIVGNGPFMLKEWSPRQKLTVVRNPHYWDAATVKLDAIEFHPIDDITAEEQAFRAGQIDVTDRLPPAKLDTYRREHADVFHSDDYLGVSFFRCNVTKAPLTDKRVRRALALALDREAITKSVLRGGQRPAYAMTPPGTAGYTARAALPGGSTPAAREAALAEAKRLLAEAGYPGGRGLPPIELLYATNETAKSVCEAVQQMWRETLGVEVRLANQEWKVYLGSQQTQNYQMLLGGWIADYNDPHVFLEILSSDNGNNNTLWKNADYDRLFQSALAAKTREARYEIYQQMDALLVDECPVIPVNIYKHNHARRPKVQGWFPTLLDIHPYKHVWLAD
jgi:oligopeptide transport system substrate-binding protein